MICDGAITNMSEKIMTQYGVGQDEFIFRMYSIALVAIVGAAAAKGDLTAGMLWILQPGTYEEQLNNVPVSDRAWSSGGKICALLLFSSMGFFGSSCAAAITKNFGALAMSITSTARKATTLFLSFLIFDNECTVQHVFGILIFMASLTAKSVRRKNTKKKKVDRMEGNGLPSDMELGITKATSYDSGDEGISNASISSSDRGLGRRPKSGERHHSQHRPRYHVV